MVTRLLIIGAYLIPFYEILVRVFPYASSFAPDTRVAKNELFLLFSIASFLCALTEGVKVRFNWIFVFVGYVFLTSHLWWNMPFQINGVNMNSVWKYQPLLCLMAGFLFWIACLNANKEAFFKHLVYSASIMAAYVVLQAFGIDQFFNVKEFSEIGTVTAPSIVGNMGQPTIVAPMLAVGLVMALFRKSWLSVVLAVALVMTKSYVAIGSVIFAGVVYGLYTSRIFRVIAMVTFIAGGVVSFSTTVQRFLIQEANGRFGIWSELVSDWRTTPFQKSDGQKYQMTGTGLGVYQIVSHVKHPHYTKFYQAHNDYLEVLYALGIVGLGILLFGLYRVFVRDFGSLDLMVSLSVLCFTAFFTFIWQLGFYQWLTIALLGLTYGGKNESLVKSNSRINADWHFSCS